MKLSTTAARVATAALLMTSALTSAAADAPTASLWSRMWRTPDQRGQALLQQGDAAGAAQAFADPERKAHAALQAHDYAGAAKTLSGVDTAEAHYNRGNALAHSGDLQGAINAYEAALKHNPQHTDARHNRDVVAAALKKQKDNKDANKQDQQENQDKNGKDDSKPGDKSGEKPGKKPDGKDGQPDNKSAEGQGDKNDKSADKHNDKQGDQSDPKPNDAPGKKPANKPEQTPSAPAPAASSPKDDAAQAQHDAESALGKTAPPPTSLQNGASAPAQGRAVGAVGSQPPLTEKQIAQEQWLRAIPDDPGGLLRRKFLIEHMLRQQGQKP